MIRRLFLSFLGAGHLRPAPGTWGSLAALPAAWGIYVVGGDGLLRDVTVLTLLVAIFAVESEIAGAEDKDPSWIVIDEVVGQWIALLPVAVGAAHAGVSPLRLWPGIVAAFLLFRLFDIWKPWIIGRLDRRGDALGLMMDDVIAGLFAAVGVSLLAALSHGMPG